MNTLQIERLLKKDLKSKAIFKKVCALDQLENLLFRLLTSSTRTRVVNLENIGLRFIPTSAVEENILIVIDYPLPWSVSTLIWMPTPYRDGFRIAKPYKRTFPVFVVIIVSILFYFVVPAYLCMLLYLILRQI